MRVGRLEDFPLGKVRVVRIEGERVAICNVDGTLYAVEDRCTHDDGPLGEGELEGCEIECPRHGARFDVRDGSVTQMPAVYPIETFELEVVDGQVYVSLD
ncbi:MAG: Rieske (2Fe-2S) protein [Vulcanimicrobiota bacterium]|nr:non-heme iron oxygenase ferredoxin subunit [Candidatus Eremiobacteraeota bacterium]